MTDEPKAGRFFIVKEAQSGRRTIVEAHTVSAALRRYAAYHCEAYPAKAAEIVELMKLGCTVIEIASGEDLELPLTEADKEDEVRQADIDDKRVARASDLTGVKDEDIL